jgi:hypothetical protein
LDKKLLNIGPMCHMLGHIIKNKQKSFQFNKALYEDQDAERQRIAAIQDVKAREIICPKCGQPITDIASAIADKSSGQPLHFDCVLNQVKEAEPTGENEKVAYIGQGRFAVLQYENIRDQRHFTIKKIIEWESREQQSQWREELSGLYSKIN